jgi:hypothetical protein
MQGNASQSGTLISGSPKYERNTPVSNPKLPIRLPEKDEEGIPFADWLDTRLEGDRQARQRLEALIQEWDLLRDEVQERESREPTIGEYVRRWNTPEATVFRFLEEFRTVFNVDYPGPVCDLLWNGMPRVGEGSFEMAPLLGVKVVEI